MSYKPNAYKRVEEDIKFASNSTLDEEAAEKAYNFMIHNLDTKAKYEEEAMLLDLYSKPLIAMLSIKSDATSDAARTKDAQANEEFLTHIENLAFATARFSKYKDLYKIADTRIQMWRTKEASSRI
jgi:hypothetical protein|tara:strand:- start:628 stop:1005 length:378 start_codon:yes stop_codon:yes gene_type:complete